ncbi:hypothetical protein [Fulvivirga sedimenti]|uniref:DUF1735 domain-containing protein n=1 Tax=Fulvivirga sedimenti TaxID=2879465 RepID=A0A9X1HP83_9BACT|nr:hypothetical protein [Fulvivirga sedimenti]MCA6073672.1 hypothetical protein [Fulvivirga sedimenti]
MKKITYLIAIMLMSVSVTSCLESDEFDGLTDNKPAIAVKFPGRTYDQQVGLGFVTTGYAGNPTITYTMELDGGNTDIESILKVEGRAGDVNLGVCGYATIEDDDIAVNARSFDYTRSLEFFLTSPALCAGVLDKPNTYFELIFTIQLTNGDQIVTMPVRGIFKQ